MARDYTFENFHMYEGNKVACLAAKKVIELPGEIFNPFYVYGAEGLGKTHLLRAINNDLSRRFTTLFLSVDAFEKIIEENRGLDSPLIVDDLHLMHDDYKERLQDIVERALTDNIQLCFSADAPPHAIRNFSPKLCSLIESGLICELQPPDGQARIEVIRMKADEAGIILSDEVTSELAHVATGSVTMLENMISRLVTYSSMGNLPIDTDSIRLILKESYPKKKGLYVSSILKEINKKEFWMLSDIGGHDLRDEYELRMHLFEMKGFDVASLRERSGGDDDELKHAYEDFTERVRRLLKLQSLFINIDREKNPVEAMKIESMLFDPARVEDIEKMVRSFSEDIEFLGTSDGKDTTGVVPLGLPGEESPAQSEMSELGDDKMTIRERIAEKLLESTPVNARDENNYMIPDIMSELIEETF
jgi:hypothetical protein